MQKKNIIAIVIASSMLTGTVSAHGIEIMKSGNSITVTANVDANSSAMLEVVKNGHTEEDLDYIYALEEAVANNDGVVTFNFKMIEEKDGVLTDGKFDVYVNQNGKDEEISSFWYASQTTTESFETALRSVTSESSLNDVLVNETYVSAIKAADFNLDIYNGIANSVDKQSIRAALVSEIGNFSTAEISKVAKSFNKQTAVKALNQESLTVETVSQTITNTGLTYGSTAYESIVDDELVSWISECIDKNAPYSDFDAVSKQYVAANILDDVSEARYNDMTNMLANNAAALGISTNETYLAYTKLSSKTDTNKNIVSAIKVNKPTNATELISIIASSMPQSSNNTGNGGGNNGGNGGSGSGGSGGSGGFAATTVVPVETPVATEKFSDIGEAKWAETAINAMVKAEIIAGDGSGKFRPNDSVTREEFVKMVVLAAGVYDETASCSFSDVPENAWYSSYVASAVNKGIINGVSDTEFGSGQTLTRQDMAVICKRALGLVKTVEASREDVEFTDEAQISDYAKAAIHELYSAGLINGVGDNAFSPLGTATRAQTAQILYNIFLM